MHAGRRITAEVALLVAVPRELQVAEVRHRSTLEGDLTPLGGFLARALALLFLPLRELDQWLDGGGLRSNTHELLTQIDVAIVAERLCEQMGLTLNEMLAYLKERGCRIGGVTLGERGLVWYDESGTERFLPALAVPPEAIIDTNGAGDIFHGAYIYSALARPDAPWREHFIFARAASGVCGYAFCRYRSVYAAPRGSLVRR